MQCFIIVSKAGPHAGGVYGLQKGRVVYVAVFMVEQMKMAEPSVGCVLLIFLFVAAIQDIKSRKIKNWWNLTGLCAAFVLSFFRKDFSLAEFSRGVLVAFALSFVCWKLRAFQAGDAKMLCVIGGLFGWRLFLCDFALTILLGGAVGIVLLICRRLRSRRSGTEAQKKENRASFPFSVVIAVSAAVTFFGKAQLEWYIFKNIAG